MSKNIFDVLVVYSSGLANSAKTDKLLPFKKNYENYNSVYSYFLETCRNNNLKAAFTTSSDIVGPGRCESYWYVENGNWCKSKQIAYSKLIFDKFSPTRKEIKLKRALLFSSSIIKPFNNPILFNMCFDKQKTYNKLYKFAIPTVSIDDISIKGIRQSCERLNKKTLKFVNQQDFSQELVLKDRFGAGGLKVFKLEKFDVNRIANLIKNHSGTSFILQPFTRFDKGFKYNNMPISADIRLIFFGKEIIQSYIRMAKSGDFRCNEHQGGVLKYIAKTQIPTKIITLSKSIMSKINNTSSLIALDFIIGNSGRAYLLEANTGPGLDWNQSIKENELEAKNLIRTIVRQLAKRARITNHRDVEINQGLTYLPA